MDIEAEKKFIIESIRKSNDFSFIGLVKAVVLYELKNQGRMSVEEYNKELAEAEARIASGQFYTQDEVEKMLRDE